MSATPYLEGGGFHSDNFIVSFKAGTTITRGQAVYLSGAYTVSPTTSSSQQLLGVSVTNASQNEAVAILCRGIVSAIAGGSISAGSYVAPSANGKFVSTTVPNAYSGGYLIKAIALTGATNDGDSFLVLLW